MVICSRSRLLLLVFCFVEAVSTKKNPKLIENDIDIAKCVANEKVTGQYMCSMRTKEGEKDCIESDHYVTNADKRKRPTSCDYGFSIRQISLSKWEMEVKAQRDTEITCTFMQISSDIVIKAKADEQFVDSNSNFKIAPHNWHIRRMENDGYTRFELGFSDFSKITSVSCSMRMGTMEEFNMGSIIPHMYSECTDLENFVLLRNSFSEKFRTKEPERAFGHNVFDFSAMCPENYDPFDNYNRQIKSLECLSGGKLELFHLDPNWKTARTLLAGTGTTSTDIKEMEVTCRIAHDDCYYCDDPDWNKATGGDKKNMSFIKGDRTSATVAKGTCSRLSCDDKEYVYFYPQIGISSDEEPRCVLDEKTNKIAWSITVFDAKLGERRRTPLESGYCKKKTSPSPLHDRMLACPQLMMPGFETCQKPKFSNQFSKYYCSDSSLTLHYAVSRGVLMAPVESMEYNKTLGKYSVTLLDGTIDNNMADDSRVVCRMQKTRIRPMSPTPFKIHPLLRAAISCVLAVLAFLVTITILVLLLKLLIMLRRYMFMRSKHEDIIVDVPQQTVTTLRAVAPSSHPISEGGDPLEALAKQRDAAHARVQASRLSRRQQERPPSHGRGEQAEAVIPTIPDMKKLSARKKSSDMSGILVAKTCLEPTKSEMELLKEHERIKECTDDEDVTGREVQPIAEDGQKKK